MNNISEEMIDLLDSTKEFYGVAEIVGLDFEEVIKLENERDTLEGDLLEEFDLLLKVAKRLDNEWNELVEHYNKYPESYNEPKGRFFELKGNYVGYIFLDIRRRNDLRTEPTIGDLETNKLEGITPDAIDRVTAMNLLNNAMDKEDITVLSLDYVGFDTDSFVIRDYSDRESNTFKELGIALIEYRELNHKLEENGLEYFFNYEDYGYHEWRHVYYNCLLYIYDGYGFFIPYEDQ